MCGKCGSSAEWLDTAGFIEVGFGSGASFAMLECILWLLDTVIDEVVLVLLPWNITLSSPLIPSGQSIITAYAN